MKGPTSRKWPGGAVRLFTVAQQVAVEDQHLSTHLSVIVQDDIPLTLGPPEAREKTSAFCAVRNASAHRPIHLRTPSEGLTTGRKNSHSAGSFPCFWYFIR